MRSKRGLSLLETMFCCALLGLFLSIVTQLVVSAYRTQGLYRDRLERQRQATVFLKKVVRQLQAATDVRLVSSLEAPTADSSLTGDGLLVTHRIEGGRRTSKFYRDLASQTVCSQLFGDSFNHSSAVTWIDLPGSPKIELRQTAAFSIEPVTLGGLDMWRVSLSLDGLPQAYERQVRRQPTKGL